MKILILNGPNLNLIGQRQPEIYGNLTFDDALVGWKKEFDATLEYNQSNVEGELINLLQNTQAEGVVFNAGAYTHTSVALRDAIASIGVPVIEVHMSNITNRESFRHESMISPVCIGCILGFGMESYRLAIQFFLLQKS
jgi:3-dehydroquinate dehydratase II